MLQTEIRHAISTGAARLPGARNGSSKGKSKKRGNEEEQLQCACHSWNKLSEARHPILSWMFHCPNGGGRSKAESGILKAMGVKPGVPDFVLPFPSAGGYSGLAIELKSETGHLSDEQRVWLLNAYKQGWCISVVRTLEQHMAVIKEFLEGEPSNSMCKRSILYGAKEIFKGAIYE